jgi:hypothetical protein
MMAHTDHFDTDSLTGRSRSLVIRGRTVMPGTSHVILTFYGHLSCPEMKSRGLTIMGKPGFH